MDLNEANKLKEESSQNKLNVPEIIEDFVKNNSASGCVGILLGGVDNNNVHSLQFSNSVSEDLIKQNKNFVELRNIPTEIPNTFQTNQTFVGNLESTKVSDLLNSNNYYESNYEENKADSKTNREKQSEAIVKVAKPLCADYKSGSESDSESVDSESDSSDFSVGITTETSSDSEDDDDDSHDSGTDKKAIKLHEKKSKRDLILLDLPPIEDLIINVPQENCVEIGTITSIVDVLVVVESYKGTAALDLDTVLFLDCGKRTLGKVFDILGPITEPIYTVRFNTQEQIKNWDIKKGLKVYFAPKTEYTNFVFMTEVLKNRGSDASWKDNAEAPSEVQDFSDDEEEKLHKSKQTTESNGLSSELKEQNKSRKRSFGNMKQTSGVLQSSRFRNTNSQQRIPNFRRTPSNSTRLNVCSFVQRTPFPSSPLNFPPRMHFPARFSGPSLPSFGGLPLVNQNQNFQKPFYQQRAHGYCQNFGSWGTPVFRSLLPSGLPLLPPPPPPPPPIEESDRQAASETQH